MRQRTIHRIGANLSWLVGERVVRMLLGVVVLGYVGRYLETARFGSFNYALSVAMLFGAVSTLGIDGIVIRELIRLPTRRDEILGTALLLKVGGALMAIGLIAISTLVFGSSEAPPHYMLLVSLAFLPQSFDVIDLWFQKNIQAKFTVMAKSASYLAGALLRVALVWTEAPVSAFCAAYALETGFFALGLCVVFTRNGMSLGAFRFRRDIAAILLTNGWPLIVSGVLVAIYQRVEQFMVWDWLGASALGVYSASTRISDMWNIVPSLILPTLYPLLVQKKLEDEREYRRRVQLVFDLMTGVGLAIALGATLTAPFLIPLIFGQQYSGAIGVMMIQAWAAPFTFSGAMRAQFFVMENLTPYHSAAAVLGIAANVVSAMLLMPTLGTIGAAAGALIGYAVSAVVSSWLFSRLHPCARYQTRSLFIIFRIRSALAEARRFL